METKFERGILKVFKKDGKTFIYAVTTLPSINSHGEHEETIELFELPDLNDSIFINHIQSHLKDNEDVICKICGKTAIEIISKERVKGYCKILANDDKALTEIIEDYLKLMRL